MAGQALLNGNGSPAPAGGQGGFWGFMGDLLNGAVVIAGNIWKPKEQQVVYVPQTAGISTQMLTVLIIVMVALIAYAIFRRRR